MVFYNDTLKTCHQLTSTGKQQYQKMLERKADEILFKHFHPIKWFIGKVKEFIFEHI